MLNNISSFQTNNSVKHTPHTLNKRDKCRLENKNMMLLEEINSSANALGLTKIHHDRPQYRRGAELKIISVFKFGGNSGHVDTVTILGQPIKQKRVNDFKFTAILEVKFDILDKNKFDIILKLDESSDDGDLHEKFAKHLMKNFDYENLIEVNGIGSELITIEKCI